MRPMIKSAFAALFSFTICMSFAYADFDDIYEAITENDLQKNAIKDLDKLIKEGASVKETDKNGLTPLHVAAWYNKKDIIEYLISKGADLNAADVKGETPLHSAAWKNNSAICAFLVSKGAKSDIVNFYGQTYSDILKEIEKDITSTPYGNLFKTNSKENNANNKNAQMVRAEEAKRLHQEKGAVPVVGWDLRLGEYVNNTRNKSIKFDSDPETGKPRATVSIQKTPLAREESVGTYIIEGKYIHIYVKGENSMKLQVLDLNNIIDTHYDICYTLKDQVSAIKAEPASVKVEATPVPQQPAAPKTVIDIKTAPQSGK